MDLVRAAADVIDAFNRADWERFEQYLAPDVYYVETGTGRRVEGSDRYLALCKAWRAAMPDVVGVVRRVLADGDTAALELRWEGTHTGPLETHGGVVEPSGRRVSVDASFWARFHGAELKEVHHHLDVLSLLRQIGADRQ
jgi:steroid delta-isomerase-like uncharacterized protein